MPVYFSPFVASLQCFPLLVFSLSIKNTSRFREPVYLFLSYAFIRVTWGTQLRNLNILKAFVVLTTPKSLHSNEFSNCIHESWRKQNTACARQLTSVPRWFFHESWYHSQTPHIKVLLEKLTVTQLVKKFLAFHGTRSVIIFTIVCYWTLPWATWIPSIHYF
jgi:hypothetical protein